MANALPVWMDPGVEPPDSLKISGWQPGMKPSAQHMNWLFNRSYMALKELQENGGIADLQEQVDTLETKVTEHLEDKANPHGVTAEQVGAVTVQDFNAHSEVTASLTTSGHTQLSNATDSTSDTLAATPSAVKQAYDRGDEAFNDTTELRAEFEAFKAALTEGFTNNQFSDGLSSLDAFNVTAGYYNLPLTRLEV